MKTCSRCGESKPLECFAPRPEAKDGHRGVCRPCTRPMQARVAASWRERNPERARATVREWKARTGWKDKRKRFRDYNLTDDDIASMAAAQGNGCAICGEQCDFKVDHDHSTGAVRGLLCGLCNSGLGFFRDRPDILLAAALYLERHAAGLAEGSIRREAD